MTDECTKIDGKTTKLPKVAVDSTGRPILGYQFRDEILWSTVPRGGRGASNRISGNIDMMRRHRRRAVRMRAAAVTPAWQKTCTTQALTIYSPDGLYAGKIWAAVTRVSRHLISTVSSAAADIYKQLKAALTVRLTTEITDLATGAKKYVSREIDSQLVKLHNFAADKIGIEQNNVVVEIPDPVVYAAFVDCGPEFAALLRHGILQPTATETARLALSVPLGGWWADFKRGFTVALKKIGSAAWETFKEVGVQWIKQRVDGRVEICQVYITPSDLASDVAYIAPYPCVLGNILDARPPEDAEELRARYGVDIDVRKYASVADYMQAEGIDPQMRSAVVTAIITAAPFVIAFIRNLVSKSDLTPKLASVKLDEGDVDYRNQPYPICPDDLTEAVLDMTTTGRKRGLLALPEYASDGTDTYANTGMITIQPDYVVDKTGRAERLVWELDRDYEDSGGTIESVMYYLPGAEWDWQRYYVYLVDADGIACQADPYTLSVTGFDSQSRGPQAAVINANLPDGRCLSVTVAYEIDWGSTPKILLAETLVKQVFPSSEINPEWIVALIADGDMETDVGNACPVDPANIVLSYDPADVIEGADVEVTVTVAGTENLSSSVLVHVHDTKVDYDISVDADTTYHLEEQPRVRSYTAVWEDGTHYYSTQTLRVDIGNSTVAPSIPGKYIMSVTADHRLGTAYVDITVDDPPVYLRATVNRPVMYITDPLTEDGVTVAINGYTVAHNQTPWEIYGYSPTLTGLQAVTIRCTDYRYQHVGQVAHIITLQKNITVASMQIRGWAPPETIPVLDGGAVVPLPIAADIVVGLSDGTEIIVPPDMIDTACDTDGGYIRYTLRGTDINVDYPVQFSATTATAVRAADQVIDIGMQPDYLDLVAPDGYTYTIRPDHIRYFNPIRPGEYHAVYGWDNLGFRGTVTVRAPDIRALRIRALAADVHPGYTPDKHDIDATCILADGRHIHYLPGDAVVTAATGEGSESTLLTVASDAAGNNAEIAISNYQGGADKYLIVSPAVPMIRVGDDVSADRLTARAYLQYLDGSQDNIPITDLDIVSAPDTTVPGVAEVRIRCRGV